MQMRKKITLLLLSLILAFSAATLASSGTDASGASVSYSSHIQDIGWQPYVSNGATSGTCGQALRLEAIRIRLENVSGSIEYSPHVQYYGWMGYSSDGAAAGTQGQSLRMEAIRIRLTGDAAAQYDVYYRVHVEAVGWMDWAMNGQPAGTAGFGFRMEAIQIVLLVKNNAPPGPTAKTFIVPLVRYQSQIQNIGWMDWSDNGATSGTCGQSLRLEAMRIVLENISGGIEYRSHIQDIGWTDYSRDGAVSGTEGRGLRAEAVEIRLTGDAASRFDVYYRVHAENFGWLDWAKNGQPAGTAGYAYRMEAIQIVLVLKGSPAPGPTATPFEEAPPADLDGTYYAWYNIRNSSHTTPGIPSNIVPWLPLYNGIYVGDTSKRIFYFTFDCGSVTGYSDKIMDVLAARGIKATFFVTKPYITKNPDIVRRMVREGHIVANHTDTHTGLPYLSDMEIRQELQSVEDEFTRVTGKNMVNCVRPPVGGYSEKSLWITSHLGYKTVFWSIAYKDYDMENQPTYEEAMAIVKNNHHNGAILLLHAASQTNAYALNDMINYLKGEGYSFGILGI